MGTWGAKLVSVLLAGADRNQNPGTLKHLSRPPEDRTGRIQASSLLYGRNIELGGTTHQFGCHLVGSM